MSDEFITMFHPDTEGVAEATEQAFEEVWKEKGWQRFDAKAGDRLSKDQLEKVAADKGVDISAATTKAEIATAIVNETTSDTKGN